MRFRTKSDRFDGPMTPSICNTCGDFLRRCFCQLQNWSLCKHCQAKVTWVYDAAKQRKAPVDGHIERSLPVRSAIDNLAPGQKVHRCQAPAPAPKVNRPWVPKPKAETPAPLALVKAPCFNIEVWADYGHRSQELLKVVQCAATSEAYVWLKSGGYCCQSSILWTDGHDWALLPWLAAQ